ncbi:SDR family NAD(P)-dependent oxidoreductase [Kineococcus indalonis]|uniref:SDR family NAD(P)-dependent oxidoreductase n=1 Tax=Kineococcus indalonis TaxID=2696566 RepID=UPI001412125F|nr:SDR family NAD(P)-dependent oxidoreductase [Kineococcus indalonis]NAZ86065.1 SDR family NAD(P)-dependent oxidoreductase [Kineococcus indalonis]
MDVTGSTALVTGASGGIGAGIARALAARGADLVLVARSAAKLEALAARARAEHGRRVLVVPLDLSTPGAGARVQEALAGREVDVLVNNAGFGVSGRVADVPDPSALTAMVTLNCTTLTDLTARFLPGMVRRGHGAVVNVASMAAYAPSPGFAAYAASKAFVLSLSQALWAETRGTGVRVAALSPTVTDTGFFDVAGEAAGAGLRRRSVEQVVATFFDTLDADRPAVVDGRRNEVLAAAAQLTPRGPFLRALGPRFADRVTGDATR